MAPQAWAGLPGEPAHGERKQPADGGQPGRRWAPRSRARAGRAPSSACVAPGRPPPAADPTLRAAAGDTAGDSVEPPAPACRPIRPTAVRARPCAAARTAWAPPGHAAAAAAAAAAASAEAFQAAAAAASAFAPPAPARSPFEAPAAGCEAEAPAAARAGRERAAPHAFLAPTPPSGASSATAAALRPARAGSDPGGGGAMSTLLEAIGLLGARHPRTRARRLHGALYLPARLAVRRRRADGAAAQTRAWRPPGAARRARARRATAATGTRRAPRSPPRSARRRWRARPRTT